MKIIERAVQAWAVLAWAAHNGQTMTYKQLEQVTGMPAAGLGRVLDPIEIYCVAKNLPPLTAIVVQKDTGLPGSGFTAAKPVELATEWTRVFEYDWLKHGNPQVEGLENKTDPTR